MRLKKLLLLGTLVTGFALTGCSVLQPGELESCTADEFCDDDSLCHPVAKVCVKTCTFAEDCPDTAKSCEPLSGDARSFCACQSTELCDGDENIICTESEKICAPKCTSDVDCTLGRACDKASGNCRSR
jgi:hypothetical protein